jgi:predicted dienelactone hydrolase
VRFLTVGMVSAALFFAHAAEANSDNHPGQPQLPAPDGKFAVGRVTYHWTDMARLEPLSKKAGAHREIMVYVWYPAAKTQQASDSAAYFPDFKAARSAITDADFKDMFRPADEQVQKSGLPYTHAAEAAKMPRGNVRYPVLVFSHGWGMQGPLYTAELEDLASHGYVIAAIDHPYDTTVTVFPDGDVVKFAQNKFDAAAKRPHGYVDYAYERVEVMANDIGFVIDQLSRYDKTARLGAPFAGHLDLDHVGAFGHSIGGMASARACQIDARIRACSDQDSTDDRGSPFPVITPASIPKQPLLLFIAASADIFSDQALHPSDESLAKQKLSRAEYDEIIQRQQKKQNELLAEISGGSYRVMLFDLSGFTHRTFSDLPLLAADHDSGKWEQALHNFQIAQAYTRGFFDKYLKGEKRTVLDSKTPPDTHVRVDRFGRASR